MHLAVLAQIIGLLGQDLLGNVRPDGRHDRSVLGKRFFDLFPEALFCLDMHTFDAKGFRNFFEIRKRETALLRAAGQTSFEVAELGAVDHGIARIV